MINGNIEEMPIFCAQGDCPVECDLASTEIKLRIIRAMQNNTAEQVLMGDNPVFDEALRTVMDAAGIDPDTDPEKLKEYMRTIAAKDMDDVDARIDASVQKRRRLGETCVKPAVAVVSSENGQRFEIEICTSSHAYDSHSSRHVPTHVQRSFEL